MKKIMLVMVGILLLMPTGMNVKAAENPLSNSKIKTEYEKMVKEGTIDKSISLERYNELCRESERAEQELEKRTANGEFKVMQYKSGFKFQKGDFIETNSTSSGGATGHAAIVTGSNSMLDAPGYKHKVIKNGKKVSLNTTRQLTINGFIKKYDKKGKKIWVFRAAKKDVSLKAAKWADTHYYSSKGTSKQDKFPKYFIGPGLTGTTFVYCSKIIYQAYYYGSGSISYVQPRALTKQPVLPYLLDTTFVFKDKYLPKLVKTYKF